MTPIRRILGAVALSFTAGWLSPPTAMAAGASLPPIVQDIGLALLISGILAVLAIRLKIPVIAAFLVAGVLIGPVGAGWVTDETHIETIAELGLVLLLFGIGMELDIRKLLKSGKTLVLTGILQYPLSVLLGVLLTKSLVWMGFGAGLLEDPMAPLYVGFVLAASSTLLVIKLFQETFQLDTVSGRMALGLLIFQDIWAIVVIALQPNFNAPEFGPIALGFLGIALLTGLAVLLARTVLTRVVGWISKMPELMLVAGIAWCFGIAFLGSGFDGVAEALFGRSLHLSVAFGMGALIAGATMANLPHHLDIISKVGPVKDFFVTLFFVGLGMGIPVPDGAAVLMLALLFSLAAVLTRVLVFFPLFYHTGLDRRNAAVTSTRLAQVSEFTLVIAYAGVGLGHISPAFNSAVIFAFVFTALLTPLLFRQADGLHERFGPILERLGFRAPDAERAGEEEHFALALLGFHRVASSLLHEIETQQPALLSRMLVVDFNVALHPDIARKGPTVRYGDLSHLDTLHHTGIGRADVILSTVPDDLLKGVTNRRLVAAVRRLNPEAVLIANAVRLEEAEALYEAGADYVYVAHVECAMNLLPAVTQALCGEISRFRTQIEHERGPWSARDEVLR
jgi:Kef-type K+ transport system membrane component KefB